jgi:leucyl-tRNA synthetase
VDRYNFKTVEEKWQKLWEEEKTFSTKVEKIKKNFIVWKCFLIHQVKFTWVM